MKHLLILLIFSFTFTLSAQSVFTGSLYFTQSKDVFKSEVNDYVLSPTGEEMVLPYLQQNLYNIEASLIYSPTNFTSVEASMGIAMDTGTIVVMEVAGLFKFFTYTKVLSQSMFARHKRKDMTFAAFVAPYAFYSTSYLRLNPRSMQVGVKVAGDFGYSLTPWLKAYGRLELRASNEMREWSPFNDFFRNPESQEPNWRLLPKISVGFRTPLSKIFGNAR